MPALNCQFPILALAVVLLIGMAAAIPAPSPQEYQDGPHTLLDIETPNSFTYNSPLQQPDSLRSRPYFDFLSTLYRRDSTKSELFRPYARTRRDVNENTNRIGRNRRAIVFRPLFVYKQQEIKKQQRRRSSRV